MDFYQQLMYLSFHKLSPEMRYLLFCKIKLTSDQTLHKIRIYTVICLFCWIPRGKVSRRQVSQHMHCQRLLLIVWTCCISSLALEKINHWVSPYWAHPLLDALLTSIVDNIEGTNDNMDKYFATVAYASKSVIECIWNISTGAILIHRDMKFNIPLLADLHKLHEWL